MIPPPPRSTLFPYTTLFRSWMVKLASRRPRSVPMTPGQTFHDERSNEEDRSEEHTSELQSRFDLVCRLLLEKKKKTKHTTITRTHHIYDLTNTPNNHSQYDA